MDARLTDPSPPPGKRPTGLHDPLLSSVPAPPSVKTAAAAVSAVWRLAKAAGNAVSASASATATLSSVRSTTPAVEDAPQQLQQTPHGGLRVHRVDDDPRLQV